MSNTDETFNNIHVQNSNNFPQQTQSSKMPCTIGQLLAIFIPVCIAGLFAAIFVPIYVHHNNKDKKIIIVNNPVKEPIKFDDFEENVTNIVCGTLTPKEGYDNILIFLMGISEVANQYIDFFKSNESFVPKGTKIYFLSGPARQMQYAIDYYNITTPIPGWFNVDSRATLYPEAHNFTEAKVSLNYVLDEIDRIKSEENIDYRNIYLGGFSQGAMMTNYVLLNSRHELGGYIPYSGYVFDHDFLENQIIPVSQLTQTQLDKLDKRKDYHIIATLSYKDDTVFYQMAAPSYQYYYENYTNFVFLSFGVLNHLFPPQPVHSLIKKWLLKRMGKEE